MIHTRIRICSRKRYCARLYLTVRSEGLLPKYCPPLIWTWMEGLNDQMLFERRMQTADWCVFTIRFLRVHLQPDSMAFIFSLGTLRAQQDHGPCQKRYEAGGDHCVADQADAQALPRHVTTDCDCPLLSPRMDEIVVLLRAGFVPRVAISLPEDRNTRVLKSLQA
ncbi:hypothetical protein PV04_01467 [Phialophora macrospora]|uniref:Uncharacterized protein n=1 Tax=Phialophora macrospora TaxID=1851006 RepID=A0A0D2EG51_9EURO|nr:hypothetical protein PV04_01467 [Phialophora macrospora]